MLKGTPLHRHMQAIGYNRQAQIKRKKVEESGARNDEVLKKEKKGFRVRAEGQRRVVADKVFELADGENTKEGSKPNPISNEDLQGVEVDFIKDEFDEKRITSEPMLTPREFQDDKRSRTSSNLRGAKVHHPSYDTTNSKLRVRVAPRKLPSLAANILQESSVQNRTIPKEVTRSKSPEVKYPQSMRLLKPEAMRIQKLAPMKDSCIVTGQVANITNGNSSPKPVQPGIIQRNIENVVSSKPKSYAYITTVNSWMKKNRLPTDSKVFIVSGMYPDMRQSLLDRGWTENSDQQSLCFHLKIALSSRDIDFAQLQDNQHVNHFGKVTGLTTKAGLNRTLRENSLFAAGMKESTFFPTTYDSLCPGDVEAFAITYKLCGAESILKKIVRLGKGGDRSSKEYQNLSGSAGKAALEVCKRRLMKLDEVIDHKDQALEIEASEWDQMRKFIDSNDTGISLGDKADREKAVNRSLSKLKPIAQRNLDDKCDGNEATIKKKGRKIKLLADDLIQHEFETNEEVETQSPDGTDEDDEHIPYLEKEAKQVLRKLSLSFPQTYINGDANIWILKPAGLSRGRGITLSSSLSDIQQQIKAKDQPWIIQKYMEKPLLYKTRKLDIRQWVLVTDWNPLCVWFYAECYVRLSTNEYDAANIKDVYSHLTNNSINKHAKGFEKEAGFLSQADFADYLKNLPRDEVRNGEEVIDDPFFEKIQPKMKEIVIATLQSVQESIENRKNSSEIYGFDFCIDDKLNSWLIEVNSSPAWDYSSSVTERLVKQASEDYIRVIVDYAAAFGDKKEKVSTGLWSIIYAETTTADKASAPGGNIDLQIVGQNILPVHGEQAKKRL
jgi:hypothetical protein